jgi:hypothetical protein
MDRLLAPQHERVLSGGRINLAELISFVEGKAKLSRTATVCGDGRTRCRDGGAQAWARKTRSGSGQEWSVWAAAGEKKAAVSSTRLAAQPGPRRIQSSQAWSRVRCQAELLQKRKDGQTWDALGDSEILWSGRRGVAHSEGRHDMLSAVSRDPPAPATARHGCRVPISSHPSAPSSRRRPHL